MSTNFTTRACTRDAIAAIALASYCKAATSEMAPDDASARTLKTKRPPIGGRFTNWRRGSESNRRRRLCRPLHNHFATPPGKLYFTRATCALRKHEACCFTYLTNEKGKLASFPFEFGAGEESRTLDLNLGKVALYQLSYSRVIKSQIIAVFFCFCKSPAKKFDLMFDRPS